MTVHEAKVSIDARAQMNTGSSSSEANVAAGPLATLCQQAGLRHVVLHRLATHEGYLYYCDLDEDFEQASVYRLAIEDPEADVHTVTWDMSFSSERQDDFELDADAHKVEVNARHRDDEDALHKVARILIQATLE